MNTHKDKQIAGNYGAASTTSTGPGRRDGKDSQVDNKRNPCKGIATWNVRTMLRTGKLENAKIEMKKNAVNILGLCETRWKDEGEFISDGYRVIHSGSNKGQGGVALILDKQTSRSLLEVQVVNERCITAKLSANPVDVVIVQVYMPTSTHNDEEVEEVYEKLEEILRKTKTKDNVVIMGDWNAVVGEEEVPSIVGKYGLGKKNDRGQRLIDFCRQEDLIIANTWSKTPKRRRYTWTSPGNRWRSQIDYILIKQRYRNQIKKTMAYPGADIASDHNLVKMISQLKWKKLRKPIKQTKWNVEMLKQNKVRTRYQQTTAKLTTEKSEHRITTEQTIPSNTIEAEWNNIKIIIKGAAEECLENKQPEIRKPWMTEGILNQMEERRKWKNVNTPKGKEMYKRLRNEVDRECKKAKENWWDEECKCIEEMEKTGRHDLVYKKIKQTTRKGKNIQSVPINNRQGNPIMDPEQRINRWHEYVSELYKPDIESEYCPNIYDNHTLEEIQVTREEFNFALKSLATSKTPGIDEIPIELIQEASEQTKERVYRLITEISKKGEWPEEFAQSLIIPIPKKTKPVECAHYRTISLICHTSKILLRILKNRLETKVEAYLNENQFGFRKGLGTREAILAVRHLGERMIEKNRRLYICFIDYEKAFDKVSWKKLFQVLREIDADDTTFNLILQLYKQQKAIISIQEGLSEPAEIRRGVRQGCLLSPSLFNIVSDKMMQEALGEKKYGVVVNGERLNAIKFADDQAIIAGSQKGLTRMINNISDKAKDYGMKINYTKTKSMSIGKTDYKMNLKIEGKTIQQVPSFQYLGQLLTDDARCSKEIRSRIAQAKKAFNNKYKLITSKQMNVQTRKRLVFTYIWPIALYAAETWTLRKQEQKLLEAFEMWCWRKMMKVSWTEKKSNARILQEIGEERRILQTIRKRQLKWTGHILRHNNLIQKIIEGKISGKKTRGRPRKTFTRQICEEVGVRQYGEVKRLAEDRSVWRTICAATNQSMD